jgi:hypothetical protein
VFRSAALSRLAQLGETNPAASNETSSGRGQDRRADVKLLVNKGIISAGGGEN